MDARFPVPEPQAYPPGSTGFSERDHESDSGASTSEKRFGVIVVCTSAIYLYINLFTFSGIPFLLGGDQVYFWTYALRLLHGEHIYIDFFTMHPPGTGLLYASLFSLFGPRIWVTNVVVLALGVGLTWLCFDIASRITERRFALLAALLFLVLVYSRLLSGTHHWFSMLAVMGAVAILLPGRSPWRIADAGALLGFASFFTQTRGVFALIGVVAFLAWEGYSKGESFPELLRRQALVFFPFIAALVLLSSYFIVAAGASTLWHFQVAYVREHFPVGPGMFLGLPEFPGRRRLPFLAPYLFVYLLLPFVYPLALYRCRRGWQEVAMQGRENVALLSLVGLCLFVEVAFSLNWLRIFVVSMPGIILFIWFAAAGRKSKRYVVPLIWCAVGCLALLQIGAKHIRRARIVALPAGLAAVKPQDLEELEWLTQHTKPGDLFFQAGWSSLYLPLQLRNPVFLDLLESDSITSPEYVQRSIGQLELERVPYVLWSPRLESPDMFVGPEQYHLRAFCNYLQTRYHRVRSFYDQDEVWERNPQ